MTADAPIGVFDSGLGGLTVVRAIVDRLPSERIVYLGDTARVPYGTRSPETILRYARSCARHLRAAQIKVLVIACNTVSAVAVDMLRVELDLPVLGVVTPGARAAVAASRNKRIGVIATAGTIASGAYGQAVASLDSRGEVFGKPAPLLVPLAEEGWLEGEVPRLAVRRYVEPLAEAGIDTLVLGCTHYPLFRPMIEEEAVRACGAGVVVVDSARATADDLAELLEDRELLRPETEGVLELRVTDLPERFGDVASRFLGCDVSGLDVQAIDL